MTATVEEQLRDLWAAEKKLCATSCEQCGHPYRDHVGAERCYWPLWSIEKASRCRCRRFIDPAETLSESACPSEAV